LKRTALAALLALLTVTTLLSWGCGKQDSPEQLNKELLVEAIEGNSAVVQQLVNQGADLNARDADGKAPLHLAVENDHAMTVQLLVNLGADVNAQDDRGWTPLHIAAFSNNTKAAKLLLDNGANINAQDDLGWTPLNISADLRYEEISRLLIERGGVAR
jgi:ankyrin repeat protein